MKRVWYHNKVYWILIVTVLVVLIVLADVAIYHGIHKLQVTGESTGLVVDHHYDHAARAKGKIKLMYDSYRYTDQKTYHLNQDVNSWDHANIKINSVTIYKLAKDYQKIGLDGKSGNCVMLINMTIKANQDISIYPTQGTVSTNNGLQANAMMGNQDFDGDIDNGISKTGDVVVVFNHVKNINDIKKLRFKFEAFGKSDDDVSNKQYDLHLNLK